VAAIQQLAAAHGELADVLANLTAVIAEEALQNVGFGARLSAVLLVDRTRQEAVAADEARAAPVAPVLSGVPAKARPKKGRRAPGPWDPYTLYAEVGESGLRDRLSRLELEQLRDIIAEHGMNTDGLAMRWTRVDRVVGRIVERVVDRASKGDAFRSA
jgi:hypothetical protein